MLIGDEVREALVEHEDDDGPLTWARDEEDGLEHATRGSFDATVFDAGYGLRLQIEIDVDSHQAGREWAERFFAALVIDADAPVITGPVKVVPARVGKARGGSDGA